MDEQQAYPPQAAPASPLPIPSSHTRALRWLDFFRSADVEVSVLLGAECVQLTGEHAPLFAGKARAAERDLCELSRFLVVERDRRQAADIALGVRYEGQTGRTLSVRLASIDEQVAAHVARLRSGRGLQLRRSEASAIAALLESLSQRAAQPFRGRAA